MKIRLADVRVYKRERLKGGSLEGVSCKCSVSYISCHYYCLVSSSSVYIFP